jgi:integrase
MKSKLTPGLVLRAACEPGKPRTYIWDTELKGFGLLITSNNSKSYVVQYRAGGRSRRMTLSGTLGVAEAKREAKKILGEVARGNDPAELRRKQAAEGTFRAIAENYFRHEGPKLRSLAERRRVFERLIYPTFAARQIDSIARRDVIHLLDKVEDQNGPRQSDLVLAYLGRLFNWHAIRDDGFRSPLVRGMARTNGKERARSRILTDDELRAVWKAAGESNGPFGAFVKFVLLTAARRDEARCMTRSEVVNGVWTIPSSRYKTKIDHVVPLSGAAIAVLAAVPQIGNAQFVFTTNGRVPIRGMGKSKTRLDAASGVHDWVLHDLRRSSRSLMSRAGVNADIGEMCLGHVLSGVRATYDRHSYEQEKRIAFEKLATLIASITNPQPNVISLDRPRVPA